jgi:hypothetical protein
MAAMEKNPERQVMAGRSQFATNSYAPSLINPWFLILVNRLSSAFFSEPKNGGQ